MLPAKTNTISPSIGSIKLPTMPMKSTPKCAKKVASPKLHHRNQKVVTLFEHL
jgi:hypothetical protein